MTFAEPTVQTRALDGVTLHTVVCPEQFLACATHIIELPHELIVVDGQLVVWYADWFRRYADGLGKPITRVYLSHDHPDHFFGVSSSFGDVPIYALPETTAALAAHGEAIRAAQAARFGDGVPKSVVLPQHEVLAGEEAIDGVRFVFERITDAEVAHQLVMRLPDYSVVVAQDLVYSGGHICIERYDIDNWFAFLNDLLSSDYQIILPGHGFPADRAEVASNIEYLTNALPLAKQYHPDAAAYKSAITALYPNQLAPQIIDIYVPRLFSYMSKE